MHDQLRDCSFFLCILFHLIFSLINSLVFQYQGEHGWKPLPYTGLCEKILAKSQTVVCHILNFHTHNLDQLWMCYNLISSYFSAGLCNYILLTRIEVSLLAGPGRPCHALLDWCPHWACMCHDFLRISVSTPVGPYPPMLLRHGRVQHSIMPCPSQAAQLLALEFFC